MRYRLRTLLAVLPPLLACGWLQYATRQAERRAEFQRQRALAARPKPRTAVRWIPLRSPAPLSPGFRRVPGTSDYQFPPQAPWRVSDEESAASSRLPIRP